MQMRPQRSSAGSAFILDTQKREVLTNAHVVSFVAQHLRSRALVVLLKFDTALPCHPLSCLTGAVLAAGPKQYLSLRQAAWQS